jgi:hypothetical protein
MLSMLTLEVIAAVHVAVDVVRSSPRSASSGAFDFGVGFVAAGLSRTPRPPGTLAFGVDVAVGVPLDLETSFTSGTKRKIKGE